MKHHEEKQPNTEESQDSIAQLQVENEQLKAEVGDLKDKLLRSIAEMENIRKRGQRESEDMARYAISKFAREIITVADNLQRALDSIPKDQLDQNPTVKAIFEGVEMTEKGLQDVLRKHGVEPINPVDESFDHNYHQAMFEVDHPEKQPGAVVEVLQIGYKIQERLLRPALVSVAKGNGKKNGE